MSLFALTAGEHYVRSLEVFTANSGGRMKNFEILQDCIPPLIQTLPWCQQRSRFNILSVGSATGEMDMKIMKITKKELQKSEQGRSMKIFNRAIEPNEYSCSLYKAAIENLPSPLNDHLTEFEICQQTFEEYKESQQRQEASVKFDMVHFIHSIYDVNIEQALIHCFEKELSEQGVFVCIVEGLDFTSLVFLMQRKQWYRKDAESEETTEKMIRIAKENGWKYEIYT